MPNQINDLYLVKYKRTNEDIVEEHTHLVWVSPTMIERYSDEHALLTTIQREYWSSTIEIISYSKAIGSPFS